MSRELSAKQEAFCVNFIKTGNATASYRAAGYAPKMRDKTANEEASRLLKHPKVSARISELRAEVTKRSVFTVDVHLRNLATLRDLAVKDRQFSAAITAEKARGQAKGFYDADRDPDSPDGDVAQPVAVTIEFKDARRKPTAV